MVGSVLCKVGEIMSNVGHERASEMYLFLLLVSEAIMVKTDGKHVIKDVIGVLVTELRFMGLVSVEDMDGLYEVGDGLHLQISSMLSIHNAVV
jgi:hypothetical protein